MENTDGAAESKASEELSKDFIDMLNLAANGSGKKAKTGGRRKKRRGAPLGNQNARKHGFYSRVLTPEQLRRLPKARAMDGFDQETALIRLRLGALMAQSDPNFTLFFRAMGTFIRMIGNTNRIRSSLKQLGIDSSL